MGATLAGVLAGCAGTPFRPADTHLGVNNHAGLATPRAAEAGADDAIPPTVNGPLAPPRPRNAPKLETYSVVVSQVEISELLFAMARDAKMNVDVHPSVQGKVTLNAINQTLPQILTRLSRQVDLRYEFDGKNLVVGPDVPFVRHYTVDYVNIARVARQHQHRHPDRIDRPRRAVVRRRQFDDQQQLDDPDLERLDQQFLGDVDEQRPRHPVPTAPRRPVQPAAGPLRQVPPRRRLPRRLAVALQAVRRIRCRWCGRWCGRQCSRRCRRRRIRWRGVGRGPCSSGRPAAGRRWRSGLGHPARAALCDGQPGIEPDDGEGHQSPA